MRYRITIDVWYDEATVKSPEELRESLENNILLECDGGELLGGCESNDPIVDDWNVKVERINY